MKKVVLGIAVLLFGFGVFIFNTNRKDSVQKVSNKAVAPTTSKVLSAENSKEKKFLFVPYWGQTAERIPDSFGDELVYFGIAPGKDGVDKEEAGYLGLARFAAIAQGRKTFLVLRMIDQDISFLVLKDQKLQEKIITETVATGKQYGFKGVVLDLEISSLPFASVTNQMDSFVEAFSKAAKKENLSFSMMFFGDTFYRLRPYDVLVLREYLDTIFIMAYDFHKAKADPGPNFPLHGKEMYGYDLTVMVNDFLNVIPKEKLVIVFGMFGYDWTVDKDGKATSQAQSLSLYQMKEKFLTNCQFKNCSIKRDDESAETEVHYADAKGNSHIVWFEDEESVAKKTEYLKQKGINAVGFWAYSYF